MKLPNQNTLGKMFLSNINCILAGFLNDLCNQNLESPVTGNTRVSSQPSITVLARERVPEKYPVLLFFLQNFFVFLKTDPFVQLKAWLNAIANTILGKPGIFIVATITFGENISKNCASPHTRFNSHPIHLTKAHVCVCRSNTKQN